MEKLNEIGNAFTCPAAVIVRNNSILLGLRNYTPDKWKTISVWTTPGGRCDPGETLGQSLYREVQEEIGITDLKINGFIGTVSGVKENDMVPIFFCTTEQEPQLMEPEKFSEWRWVPVNEYIGGSPWSDMNPAWHELISKFLRKEI